jgi:hypothetical protein
VVILTNAGQTTDGTFVINYGAFKDLLFWMLNSNSSGYAYKGIIYL